MNPSQSRVRVIDSLWTFFVAVAVVGPFALPLLWRNPRFQVKTKVIGSIAILAFTAFLLWGSGHLLKSLNDQLSLLQQASQSQY